jgi:hypothetical protein
MTTTTLGDLSGTVQGKLAREPIAWPVNLVDSARAHMEFCSLIFTSAPTSAYVIANLLILWMAAVVLASLSVLGLFNKCKKLPQYGSASKSPPCKPRLFYYMEWFSSCSRCFLFSAETFVMLVAFLLRTLGFLHLSEFREYPLSFRIVTGLPILVRGRTLRRGLFCTITEKKNERSSTC